MSNSAGVGVTAHLPAGRLIITCNISARTLFQSPGHLTVPPLRKLAVLASMSLLILLPRIQIGSHLVGQVLIRSEHDLVVNLDDEAPVLVFHDAVWPSADFGTVLVPVGDYSCGLRDLDVVVARR